MYREQNYIFSFTFVYKSKTACLKKTLVKKQKKGKKRKKRKNKKNKYPQTTFGSFFLDSEDFFFHRLSYGFGFILLKWHYFICNNRKGIACMKF